MAMGMAGTVAVAVAVGAADNSSMMDQETFRTLRQTLRELRLETELIDGQPVPRSVRYLHDLIARTKDPWERFRLRRELRGEHSRLNQPAMEIDVARQAASELADEPMPSVSLAECLWMNGRADEASEVIERAVQMARSKGRFLRYALGARARIASSRKDYAAYATSLEQLIDTADSDLEDDIGLEDDFLPKPTEQLPPDLEVLVQRYRAVVLDWRGEDAD